MNSEFAESINPYLAQGQFVQAIELAENQLATLSRSPFHKIIKRPLLHHATDLCFWINRFYSVVASNQSIEALYLELTEFDINFDVWGIDGLAYSADLGIEDTEWLAEPSAATEQAFILEGYEDLQRAFEESELGAAETQDAQDWCEQLIIARFMQLVQAAHHEAQNQGLPWAALPIYCTEHGYDFVIRSVNNE
jgi:hypothetical protein